MNTFFLSRYPADFAKATFLAGLILACGLFVLVFCSRVSAQTTNFALSVNPPVNYLWLKPGDKKTIPISVQNQGNQKVKVTTRLVNFRPDSSTGQPLLEMTESVDFPYLSSNETDLTFTLEPQAKQTISLPIVVATAAQEREYHLSFLVSAQPDTEFTIGQTNGAQVSGVVASNLIVTISNTSANRGHLEITKYIGPELIDSLQPLQFQLLAENTGPHAVAASGSAIIRDWSGKQVAEFQFYPDVVLSQGRRLLRSTNPPLTSPTDSLATLTDMFKYDALWLLGPYTIQVELWGMGDQAKSPVTYSHQVLALPFSGIVVGVLMAGCWIIYVFWITKRDRKRTKVDQVV